MKLLMRVLRHLSIRGLVLLSVGVTLLPLLAGLASAIFAVDRLASLSEQAVHQVAREAKAGQSMQDRLDELERKGRKYLGARDAAAFKEYRQAHDQFADRLPEMLNSALIDDSRLGFALGGLAREEKNVFDSIISRLPPLPDKSAKADAPPGPDPCGDASAAADCFRPLALRARGLSYQYAAHVEQEARRLEALSDEVKHRLVIVIALLLPIACVLLAVFIYLLHNPIQQIDHIIRALGAGNFTKPVRVVGPGDMEFLGERLEWLRSRLNDLEMAKQRFVRNVSHEVKTPLATIHEGTDLLLDEVVGELNQEQKEIARILVSNADRLDRLVAELINYSQVSARREYQKATPVDMRHLLLTVLDDYQLQVRGKSITVAKSLDALELMGNREQLRTIVDNLLSNAVKYSPPGGEVRLSLRKDGGHMELEIEDDGPGIDPDERARVFEPFFQGRAARELGVKGTGFGLAIVAECVANHHGKVEVLESHDEGAGARIRVQIPVQSFV
jgi:two-component system sensor histidine kinase GlrK